MDHNVKLRYRRLCGFIRSLFIDNAKRKTTQAFLEEAIEYCNSEQMGAWMGTEGAVDWVRDVVLRGLHAHPVADGELSTSDLQWKDKIDNIKKQYEEEAMQEMRSDEQDSKNSEAEDDVDSDEDSGNEEGSVVDTAMFAGMFETAMEMLEESGKLAGNKSPKE